VPRMKAAERSLRDLKAAERAAEGPRKKRLAERVDRLQRDFNRRVVEAREGAASGGR
jgi:hypothetical protein